MDASLSHKSVSELKSIIEESGLSYAGIFEKDDLRELAARALRSKEETDGVEFSGVRTREQRDAEGRAKAVDVDDSPINKRPRTTEGATVKVEQGSEEAAWKEHGAAGEELRHRACGADEELRHARAAARQEERERADAVERSRLEAAEGRARKQEERERAAAVEHSKKQAADERARAKAKAQEERERAAAVEASRAEAARQRQERAASKHEEHKPQHSNPTARCDPSSAPRASGQRRGNLNDATREALITIPSIGDKLALQILKERASGGRFHSYEDAKRRICGLGDGKVELLRRYFEQCS